LHDLIAASLVVYAKRKFGRKKIGVFMTKTVKGFFEVKSKPLPADETTQTVGAMRMKFEKRFVGPLAAESLVSMMGMMNQSLGSGGYVAMEKITGILEGRSGSFCMQHSSSMKRGIPSQTITVVPDSGTEQLQGLSGDMVIEIIDGKHFYSFSYDLP
jgi:hypothetical protein